MIIVKQTIKKKIFFFSYIISNAYFRVFFYDLHIMHHTANTTNFIKLKLASKGSYKLSRWQNISQSIALIIYKFKKKSSNWEHKNQIAIKVATILEGGENIVLVNATIGSLIA